MANFEPLYASLQAKRINPISLILIFDSYNGSHYALHSVFFILAVDLNRTFRFSTLFRGLTTWALPSAHSAVGLPRMAGIATRAIRDATSCQQTMLLTGKSCNLSPNNIFKLFGRSVYHPLRPVLYLANHLLNSGHYIVQCYKVLPISGLRSWKCMD